LLEAADIALRHTLFGFTIMLRKREYDEFYIAGHRPREVPLDSQYGICFRACLSTVPQMIKDALPDKGNIDIYFVLESGHKNYGDAERIFHIVKKRGPPEIAKMLHTVSAGDKRDYPGLQAADVNAHTGFNSEGLADPGYGKEVVYTVKEAKKVGKTKSPVFRMHVKPETLTKFKSFILDEIEEKTARRKKR
jgi:hypothetical protein